MVPLETILEEQFSGSQFSVRMFQDLFHLGISQSLLEDMLSVINIELLMRLLISQVNLRLFSHRKMDLRNKLLRFTTFRVQVF
jgi:hypothetical protein